MIKLIRICLIRRGFSRIYYHENKETFQKSFTRILSHVALEYNIEIEATPTPDYFDELLLQLYNKTQQPIIILIDEYDKPITSFLTNIEKAKERRDWLREYYAVLKPNATKIKQIFITGISKYAKTSIFSELNNVKDITLNPQFNNIVGFTQADIEENFSTYITDFQPITG